MEGLEQSSLAEVTEQPFTSMQAWALQSLQAKRMTLFSFSATPEQGNAPYKNPDMLMAGWMFLWRWGENQQPGDRSESRPGIQGGGGGRHLICVASWEDGTAVAEDTLTL